MGYHLNARYGAAGNAPGRLSRGLVAVILSFALFLQGAIPVQAALFGSFGVKDEKELGRKFDVLVRSRMPLVEDPEIKGYIQSIVDRLSKTFPPQPFPFTANVLLHNSMNAFAVPGGSVFVHTGLIMQLDHESELAGVLGHELAHVTQRHIATRMERRRPSPSQPRRRAGGRPPGRRARQRGHLRGQRGRRAGRHAQLQPHG